MSKEATPKLTRALVDYFEGGRLLYARGNVYPLDERLELLKARGEAEDYKPVKPVGIVKAQKSAAGQVPPTTDSATGTDGSTTDDAAKAAAAAASAAAGTSTTETEK